LAAHAWLFAGPAGVGKTTIAAAFLARLACTGDNGLDPCGRCKSCLAYERGDPPDLAVLRRDGQFIKIEQVRDATARLHYPPVLAGCKAVLIDDAETLHEAAANALLKTLEEPPDRVAFVLVSARPQLLLQTIVSRCQVLRFGELAQDDLAALLAAEGQAADVARTAAALAQGSLHAARVLCDPARLDVVDAIARFVLKLGQGPATDAALFVDDLAGRLRTNDGDGRGDLQRDDLPWLIDVVRGVLRDALLSATGWSNTELPHGRHGLLLREMAGRCEPRALADVIDRCGELDERLSLYPNPKLALTALLCDGARLLRGG
jgi:DNA polymerase-3 subunit delta'